jgi:F420-dependent oxidoreductase-like protein/mutator protein MutT
MKIGIMLPQEWKRNQIDPEEAYETMTHVAQEAERLGFDSVWLFDHFDSASASHSADTLFFECWSSIAALARDTTRIRVGQLVTCNSFRNPALLAKMASTIDVLSHGRLTLGISAGWNEQEYLAYGYPFPDAPTRLRHLREALQIIKAMWREEEAHFEGTSYRVQGAINQPKGVQKPHIPLLVAGKGEQVTLKLVAQHADACNFTHPTPEEMERKFALLKHYCEARGRDYQAIHRTIYVNGCLGETDAEAIAKASNMPSRFSLDHIRLRGLLGSPKTIRLRFQELEHQGVQEVIIFMRDVASITPLHLLAQALGSQVPSETTSIILINKRNQLLLHLRDDKPTIPYPNMWGLPGGYVEEGETPEQCITREMKEELGIELEAVSFVAAAQRSFGFEYTFWSNVDFPVESIALTEGQAIKWVHFDEVRGMILAYDGNAILEDFLKQNPKNEDYL